MALLERINATSFQDWWECAVRGFEERKSPSTHWEEKHEKENLS